MNSSFVGNSKNIAAALCCCAAMISTSLMADDHTVASGVVETLSNVSESTRTRKYGDGTLILEGNNSLYGLYAREGTLKINGGTTTITGPGGADQTLATFAYAGATTIIEGGATVIVNNTSGYSSLGSGGSFMVTNGTYDITGKEFLNGFNSATSARIIVQDEGVLKAYRIRVSQSGSGSAENIGVFLNRGGKLYIKEMAMFDNDSARHGVIRYNGGTIYLTEGGEFYYNNSSASWNNVLSYVDEGGFNMVNDTDSTVYFRLPFLSGAANDGGVHYSSTKDRWFFLAGTFGNSTFNGGTWLDGYVTLVNYSEDGGFGAVPSTPQNNIFLHGTNTVFGGGSNYTLHRNRNIKVSAATTATFASNNSETGFRIGGEISVPDGEDAAKDTIFNAGNGTWGGFVVLDPGEGRTNRFDRINVARNLEIASGVTIVRSPRKGTEAGGPIYIAGNNSSYSNGYNGYGCLKVSGGKLVIDGNRYVTAHKWGQVLVNGGTISGMVDGSEYLNGLSSTPGTLTIENGGMIEFCLVRVAQGWDRGSVVNVNTGGVLRAASVRMDNRSIGTLNLNGGTIVTYVSPTMSKKDVDFYLSTFLGNDATNFWDRVEVRVLAGGAKFNTDGYEPTVCRPLISGVGEGETDGGLTKSGSGTLTMNKTSTYNGPTRLDGGTLKFADTNDESGRGGRPDTDIEFTAQALMDCDEHPFIEAPSLGMGAGKVIRVTECDTLDDDAWQGKWHTVATFDNDIAALPNIEFVNSDGTVAATENGWKNWTFRISADGKSLQFRCLHGSLLFVR